MEGAGDHPELFGAAGGGKDHFRMAAGKDYIFFIADEEYGKSTGGYGILWRNFRDGKARNFSVAIEQRPGAGSEKSFAEPGKFLQASVIVRSFAETGERSFGDDGFDARIGGRGLQNDSGAHGFPKSEDMK